MAFRSGRLSEVLLGSTTTAQDISGFLYSAEWNSYVDMQPVSTFKNTWKAFISGDAYSQFFGYGYYDPTLTAVRLTLQAAPGILTYAPAGATTIGDPTRLLSFNTKNYKESPRTSAAINFTWGTDTTAQVGLGVSLHPLASEGVGTVTGTGDACGNAGVATTTGAIGHLHLTAYTSGTHTFKFQDSTTLGGAYTDIASGAFTNMTAVGSQRLIIPGTIRQFVRCVATIGTTAATYAVSFART